ncbi:MAG: MerR family transcriptional regulator [Acidobacteriota bacterium]|nr:MAG: MerR family transcriptional regulator [Acidobacteriota bacterium]
MNITLSADEDLLRRARAVARSMGKSLNQVIREYLEQLTQSGAARDELIAELRSLSLESGGRSKGWTFDRDELHERS